MDIYCLQFVDLLDVKVCVAWGCLSHEVQSDDATEKFFRCWRLAGSVDM